MNRAVIIQKEKNINKVEIQEVLKYMKNNQTAALRDITIKLTQSIEEVPDDWKRVYLSSFSDSKKGVN